MLYFNKLWTSILGAVALGLTQYLTDGRLTVVEVIQVGDMIAAVVLVGQLTNSVWSKYAKGLAQIVAGSVPVLLAQLIDGWQTSADLLPVLIAVGTAAGVIRIPNIGYVLRGGSGPFGTPPVVASGRRE